MKRVLVFGVFDGLHDGHRTFLREAKKLGDYLIVVVAPDRAVYEIKGRLPLASLKTRVEVVEREHLANEVAAGDEKSGSWGIIDLYKPDVIAFGYDQKNLKIVLEKYIEKSGKEIEIKEIPAYEPEVHHSSILAKNGKGRG